MATLSGSNKGGSSWSMEIPLTVEMPTPIKQLAETRLLRSLGSEYKEVNSAQLEEDKGKSLTDVYLRNPKGIRTKHFSSFSVEHSINELVLEDMEEANEDPIMYLQRSNMQNIIDFMLEQKRIPIITEMKGDMNRQEITLRTNVTVIRKDSLKAMIQALIKAENSGVAFTKKESKLVEQVIKNYYDDLK